MADRMKVWKVLGRQVRRHWLKIVGVRRTVPSGAGSSGRDWQERMMKAVVSLGTVKEVVAEWAGIPSDHIDASSLNEEQLDRLEAGLRARIVGQDCPIRALLQGFRRRLLIGSADRRPIGCYLFLGPSGVGKTETARALALL